MAIVGFKCINTDENVSFDDCLKCALTYENNCHFPAEIINGIIQESTDTREGISVTKLLGCPRSTYLVEHNDVYVSLDNLYWLFRGTLTHAIMEKYKLDPDAITEKRFKRKIKGLTITGKPDIIVPKAGLIRDWKTTKEVPYYSRAYPNHEQQLNLYRWLINKKYKIDKLEVVYMDMSRVKICSVKKVWKLSDCEDFITKRASVLAEALKSNIPPPVPGEFPLYWQCRDYCACRDICAKLWQEETRQGFEDWSQKEWAGVNEKP